MTCSTCGFEAERWRRRDITEFFEIVEYWWRVGSKAPVTGGDAWPAQRMAAVLADVAGLEVDGGDVRTSGEALSRFVASLPAGPSPHDEALLDAVHDLSHQMMDIGRALRPAIGEGRIEQVNVSPGGVPKLPVEVAEVGWRGVAGDRQSDRKHHGRPFQAVCLWSAEVIDALAAEGHPIFRGAAGENLTVSGLDWAQVRPGATLAVGPRLQLEVSWPATPCRHQAQWFTDGDFKRIHQDVNIDLVRWYAWVRKPGPAEVGAPVRLPSAP